MLLGVVVQLLDVVGCCSAILLDVVGCCWMLLDVVMDVVVPLLDLLGVDVCCSAVL